MLLAKSGLSDWLQVTLARVRPSEIHSGGGCLTADGSAAAGDNGERFRPSRFAKASSTTMPKVPMATRRHLRHLSGSDSREHERAAGVGSTTARRSCSRTGFRTSAAGPSSPITVAGILASGKKSNSPWSTFLLIGIRVTCQAERRRLAGACFPPLAVACSSFQFDGEWQCQEFLVGASVVQCATRAVLNQWELRSATAPTAKKCPARHSPSMSSSRHPA